MHDLGTCLCSTSESTFLSDEVEGSRGSEGCRCCCDGRQSNECKSSFLIADNEIKSSARGSKSCVRKWFMSYLYRDTESRRQESRRQKFWSSIFTAVKKILEFVMTEMNVLQMTFHSGYVQLVHPFVSSCSRGNSSEALAPRCLRSRLAYNRTYYFFQRT